MLFPSKFTNFEESIIAKMILILELKERKSIAINLLYLELEKKFDNIDEFIFALDALFALGYIEIKNEDLIYVNRN